MPDPDLSHVEAIIADLNPLSDKQRGTPLRADDWNVLVSAVRELAQITRGRALNESEALAAGYSAADHEHVGEVSLAWLDGATRVQVEGEGGGSGGSFEIRDDIKRLDRGVSTLSTEVKQLREAFNGTRELLFKLRDDVFGSKRDFGKFKLRLEALKDIELNVTKYRNEFANLGGRFDEVLSLRDKIGDGDGMVDLSVLSKRVNSLENMREKLVGGDAIPDLRELQQEMIKLSDRMGGVGPASPIELSGASKEQLQKLLDSKLGVTGERLTLLENGSLATEKAIASQDQRLSELDGLSTKIGQLDGRVTQFDVNLSKLGEQSSSMDLKFSKLDGRVSSFDTRLENFQPKLDGMVAPEGLAPGNLDGIRGRLDLLEGGLASTNERFVGKDAFALVGARLETFADKSAVEQLGGALANFSKLGAARDARIEGFDQSLADAGAGLDDLGVRFGSLEGKTGKIESWRSGVDVTLSGLSKLEGGGSVDEAALLGLSGRLTSLEVSLESSKAPAWRAGVEGRLNGLETEVVSGEEARTALGAKLASQGQVLTSIGEGLGGARGELEGLAGWRDGTQAKIETLGARAGELEGWRASSASSLGAMESKVAGLAAYGGRLDSLEASTGSLVSWRGESTAELQSLSSSLSELDGVNARVGKLEAAPIAALDKRINDLGSALGQLTSRQQASKKVLNTHGARLQAAESSIGGLGTQLSNTKKGLQSLGQTLSSTNVNLQQLSSWRSNVTQQISALGKEQLELGEQFVGVESQLSKVNALSGISSRLNLLENSTKSLTSWRGQTDQAVSKLQVETAKNKELRTQVTQLEGGMKTLDGRVSKLRSTNVINPRMQPIRRTPR